jgi:hypothetical protein
MHFMAVIFLRSLLVLLSCALANTSYAEQDAKQANILIQQGKTDDSLGNSQKAVSEYRDAMMLQFSDSLFDEAQILATLNLYGESYSRIGLFSVVPNRDKDEELLRALAQYALNEKNLKMSQMIHGLLLYFGEKRFGNPSKGIQYSYLRADPLQPTFSLEKPLPRIASVNNISDLAPCQQKRAFFQLVNPAITDKVKAYRKFEIDFFDQAIRPSL